jgi:Uma2 family endonuclease
MIAVANPLVNDPSEARRMEREAGIEFVDGHIVEKPMSVDSAYAEGEILHLLKTAARGNPLAARVFPSSMGYRCYPDDPMKFRKPDVSVVRAERLKGIDGNDGFITIPADLVIEVISPNDLHFDVAEKVEEYLENGFRIVWLVNPHTRTVEIYRAGGSISLLHEDDEITAEEALPGFKCRVKDFFSQAITG